MYTVGEHGGEFRTEHGLQRLIERARELEKEREPERELERELERVEQLIRDREIELRGLQLDRSRMERPAELRRRLDHRLAKLRELEGSVEKAKAEIEAVRMDKCR